MKLRVGTRASKLALLQTEEVIKALKSIDPCLQAEVVRITTTGDRLLDAPLARIGQKGVFVKEIEEALLQGRIDIAVHSMKDLPTKLPEGLMVAAVPKRLDPRDVLLLKEELSWPPSDDERLRVGTSSLRRKAQLQALWPSLEVVPLRGNLDTRLRKLREAGYDLIVVALSGLIRLFGGVPAGVRAVFDERILPAPGQGALAVECREGSPFVELLSAIEDPKSAKEVLAERNFLEEMGGGCQVPLGALARCEGEKVVLRAAVFSPKGDRSFLGEMEGFDPVEVGRGLARSLKAQGAEEVLKEVYHGS